MSYYLITYIFLLIIFCSAGIFDDYLEGRKSLYVSLAVLVLIFEILFVYNFSNNILNSSLLLFMFLMAVSFEIYSIIVDIKNNQANNKYIILGSFIFVTVLVSPALLMGAIVLLKEL